MAPVTSHAQDRPRPEQQCLVPNLKKGLRGLVQVRLGSLDSETQRPQKASPPEGRPGTPPKRSSRTLPMAKNPQQKPPSISRMRISGLHHVVHASTPPEHSLNSHSSSVLRFTVTALGGALGPGRCGGVAHLDLITLLPFKSVMTVG